MRALGSSGSPSGEPSVASSDERTIHANIAGATRRIASNARASMNPSPTSRHLLASLALMLSMTAAIVVLAQPGERINGNDSNSSKTNTITHNEPPPADDRLTAEEMRAAKPLPMPSIDRPPVPPQMTPAPYTGPAVGSPPGLGGPVQR
jgi:hypothetical protein